MVSPQMIGVEPLKLGRSQLPGDVLFGRPLVGQVLFGADAVGGGPRHCGQLSADSAAARAQRTTSHNQRAIRRRRMPTNIMVSDSSAEISAIPPAARPVAAPGEPCALRPLTQQAGRPAPQSAEHADRADWQRAAAFRARRAQSPARRTGLPRSGPRRAAAHLRQHDHRRCVGS